jgi:hypothetical protein
MRLFFADLGEHRGIGAAQDERALVIALDDETSVAVHGLADVDRHRWRHREARPAVERGQHVVGGVAGRAAFHSPSRVTR